MTPQPAEKISQSPKYQELVRRRNRLGWSLTALMLLVYFGFLYLVAFQKSYLATPLNGGVTTISIPLGLGVIIFTVLITGYYVYRANSEFDRIIDELKKEFQ